MNQGAAAIDQGTSRGRDPSENGARCEPPLIAYAKAIDWEFERRGTFAPHRLFDVEVNMGDAIGKGDIVGDKYRIEGTLGVGAMGIVYAAHHLQLDERVALKVLRSELTAYPDAIKRFGREARAAAKIKNEHVTRVFDVGELADGTPYIVMESLEGEDLARWLAARGTLPLEEAITFVLQACEALIEAHVLGIVHRDLKPSNLFCSRRPDGSLCIKVLDFGISKIAALATSVADIGKTSGANATVGSPFYMSPEQMQSAHDVDHRADIWALGVILFELLTGQVPFGGESLPEVCIKVATRAPHSLRALRSDIPEEVEATILKCLEKDPRDRFENVAEFAGSLFPYAGKTARVSIERIVQVSQRRTSTASPSLSAAPVDFRPSERATIRPLGATVPPARADSDGKLAWVGLGGAAAVALGVILFWTRPIGNGDSAQPVESSPPAKAAAAPPPVKTTLIPQRPENLPIDEPTTPVAAPVASTAPATPRDDDESENKRQRRTNADPASSAAGGPRPPKKEAAEPGAEEPGVDLRRLPAQKQPRRLDEVNPYLEVNPYVR
jgi:eukaryotic-like serine/threonine-protein kinase